MNCIKTFLLSLAMIIIFPACINAQLRKTASIEKVKSFTNGSVILNKTTTTDSVSVYSVTLRNNSKFHQDIVFFLGNKEDVIKNLEDLSTALKNGKKGDNFDFSAIGVDYKLSYDKVLGQVCFRIRKSLSTSTDFGRLYKTTIDDIIGYLNKTESIRLDQ